jgi:hypothetical protein
MAPESGCAGRTSPVELTNSRFAGLLSPFATDVNGRCLAPLDALRMGVV